MLETEPKNVNALKKQLKSQIQETARLKGRLAEVTEEISRIKEDIAMFKEAIVRDVRKIAERS